AGVAVGEDHCRASVASGAARDEIEIDGTSTNIVYADGFTVSGDANGSAPDLIITGNGSDIIYGDSLSSGGQATGSAPDVIRSRGGDDLIRGDHTLPTDTGGGRDRIYAGSGVDTMYGGPLFDLCDGGADAPDVANDCERTPNVP
ncbi:MAG: hypothetical protein ACKOPI_00885, partial [bacterium]